MSGQRPPCRTRLWIPARLIAIAGPVARVGVSATAAAARTVTPMLLVANAGGNTLTSYPLSATDNPGPAWPVYLDRSGSLAQPGSVAVDAAGDLDIRPCRQVTLRDAP